MEKSLTRLSHMQKSVGATSSTKSPIQECSKTFLCLTANTWVTCWGTVTLLPIPHNSILKIPVPGVAPHRQLLVSPTLRQSRQNIKTWTLGSQPPKHPTGSSQSLEEPCWCLLLATPCAKFFLEPYPWHHKGYHFPMFHISYLNCPVKSHSWASPKQ